MKRVTPTAANGEGDNEVAYLPSILLWLLLALVIEEAWVFAHPVSDPRYGRALPLSYNLALLLLACVTPLFAKRRYLKWVAASMPAWILLVVVLGGSRP